MATESRSGSKGIGALLGAVPTVSPSRGAGTLPVSLMQPAAFQPRRDIDQQLLEELAASIKANGMIQPIVVRRLPATVPGGARYEIVAGERRWQAAKLAGLADIPTIVRELTDPEAVAVALIENIQREDLTAAEEARALKRLTEEFHLTHQSVAESVGRSRAAVSNLIRLLDLPERVVAMIDSKALGMGHARALLALTEDAEREKAAQTVAVRGLSVRETEKLVRKTLDGEREAARPKKPLELSVVSEVLRTETVHVQLHQRASGAGKIIVDFNDLQTRDAILALIKSYKE